MKKTKEKTNWKQYSILLIASILSFIALIPYVTILQAEALANAPLPLPVAILISIFQTSIFLAIFVFLGLKLQKKSGLQTPIITSFLSQKKVNLKKTIKLPIILGMLAALLLIVIDTLFVKLGINFGEKVSAPIWTLILASFYGGIAEEVIMRLFFMNLIIWIATKISKSSVEAKNRNLLVWTAIILAAIIFGIGHLPATASLISLTPLVILRAILLNGIGGVIFGWLYWKKGLEYAMISHFSTDILIHVLYPLL